MTTASATTPDKKNQWVSTAGPRQTKQVKEAMSALSWHGQQWIEITDHGRVQVGSLFGGCTKETSEAILGIGNEFNWSITRENFKQIIDACQRAIKSIKIPEVDKRSTPEERAERAAAQAERERQDAERKRQLDEAQAKLPKPPAWAEAAIVANLHCDASDIQSDYFGHTTERSVLIGWRRGKREDFGQLRAAAARFSETAHLGPGKDRWTVRLKYATDHDGHYKGDWAIALEGYVFSECGLEKSTGATSWHSMRFSTEAEADALIEQVKASGMIANEPVEIVADCASVEHRENYSMGGGNYLMDGYRHSTGWCVKSVTLGQLAGMAAENGIAVEAEQDTPDAMLGSHSKCEVQKHFHTKRGFDYWLVVTSNRVDEATYRKYRSQCEQRGGWYNRQWGRVPGGYAFREQADAEKFAAEVIG